MRKGQRRQCYSCFEEDTFQYHGVTRNYAIEVSKYKNGIYEGMIVDCGNCGRIVQYKRCGENWREESE